MLSTFNTVYSVIIKLAVIIMGCVIILLSLIIPHFFLKDPAYYIPFVIIGIIISILIGAYLYIILTIPFQLPQKFDFIKNNVALKKYPSLQELQTDVGKFIVSFFNFIGLDIVGGKFHFVGCEPMIIQCEIDIRKIQKEDFISSKKRFESNHTAFLLPIKLEDHDLGYMILVTKGYTLPILYSILKDFEDYYLDDQILQLKNK